MCLSQVNAYLGDTYEHDSNAKANFQPMRTLTGRTRGVLRVPVALGWFSALYCLWASVAWQGHPKHFLWLLFILITAIGGAYFILLFENGYLMQYSENASASSGSAHASAPIYGRAEDVRIARLLYRNSNSAT
jgi:hypothetical protein